MFPIRGLVVKKDYQSLWVVYNHDDTGEEACSVEEEQVGEKILLIVKRY